jgi:adenylosuccinate synthase
MESGSKMSGVGYILSGTSFGDEGKGSFIDYLAFEKGIRRNVRYNGGSQASHTVTLDGGVSHRFSQLGSSMFLDGNITYLSGNTVINLFNLAEEARRFSLITGLGFQRVIDNVYLSNDCWIATPYHLLTNQVRELSRKNSRRGSVGTGVSEVVNVFEDCGIRLCVSDLFNGGYDDILEGLYSYARDFCDERLPLIDDGDLKHISEKGIEDLTAPGNRRFVAGCYENLLSSVGFNVIGGILDFSDANADVVFEGSQGLLLDRVHGVRPNTTLLDTTNHYAVQLAGDLGIEPVKVGIISAIMSRHGLGALPTFDASLSEKMPDTEQESTFFQGRKPVYGWFDSVLTRYAHRINGNDEYFISCVDKLYGLDTLKICNSYQYNGVVDSDFEEVFEFRPERGDIVITDIRSNSPRLNEFLCKCSPMYVEMPGLKSEGDYSGYINMIEELAGIRITLISVGEKRSDKIRRTTE